MLAVTIEPMTTMKNNIILVLLALLLHSCNYAQELKVNSEIQDFFDVKGNVKEITTTKKNFTTMGERKYESKTTFNKEGEPIETIDYDENGNVESKKPWTKANENDFKGWEVKEVFDAQKRLIKRTKYNNGKISFENYYKYDLNGNKIEDFEKINNEKTEFKYINNLLSEEITFIINKAEGNKFYWYCKKKFSYDEKSNLTEMIVYYYPDDKIMKGKYNYKYDSKGSLIEKIAYVDNEISEISTRKIVYY
ncbi:hypothetical protein D3C87_1006770 [compost metagenome]